jgi:2,3-bisphosphoglycerate-dependent phosphoglycerate mutase
MKYLKPTLLTAISVDDDHPPTHRRLRFVRHGATALNLAGLRCGGDLDMPLTHEGRAQALAVAGDLAGWQAGGHAAVGVIVTSHLQRTRETAEIIARHLGGMRVVVQPLFAERHLGAWNCLPIAQTQARLLAGSTPPGGEANVVFEARVAQALQSLAALWAQAPLLVSSQGVARVLGQMAGLPAGARLANAQVTEFNLPQQFCGTEQLETV